MEEEEENSKKGVNLGRKKEMKTNRELIQNAEIHFSSLKTKVIFAFVFED